MSYATFRDGVTFDDPPEAKSFKTFDEAIEWGRERQGFAVYDDDDNMIFEEHPIAEWR